MTNANEQSYDGGRATTDRVTIRQVGVTGIAFAVISIVRVFDVLDDSLGHCGPLWSTTGNNDVDSGLVWRRVWTEVRTIPKEGCRRGRGAVARISCHPKSWQDYEKGEEYAHVSE